MTFSKSRCLLSTGLLLSLTGCGGLIPKDGPTGDEVRVNAEVAVGDQGRLSYAMVAITPLVLRTIQTEPQPVATFSRLARSAPSADVRVGVGDTVSISVFEAGAGGLFVPADAGARPGNFVQIPTQEVDRNGNIQVPFGGPIRALGRTTREIAREIEDRLKQRAIEPQAIVSVGERSSNVVSVLGDVGHPDALPVRPGGMRVLTALARAGGAKFPSYDSIVTLQRGARIEQANLSSILADPKQDVQIEPGDVVNVSYQPRIYLAFGATTGSTGTSIQVGTGSPQTLRRVPFEAENLTLAEAIAKAGGLDPARADPRAVFLFRYTPREILQQAGVDLSNIPQAQVPTVYTMDLLQAEGYFIANNFYMKHKDILLVSDHPTVDLLKFLTVVTSVETTTTAGIAVATGAKSLR